MGPMDIKKYTIALHWFVTIHCCLREALSQQEDSDNAEHKSWQTLACNILVLMDRLSMLPSQMFAGISASSTCSSDIFIGSSRICNSLLLVIVEHGGFIYGLRIPHAYVTTACAHCNFSSQWPLTTCSYHSFVLDTLEAVEHLPHTVVLHVAPPNIIDACLVTCTFLVAYSNNHITEFVRTKGIAVAMGYDPSGLSAPPSQFHN